MDFLLLRATSSAELDRINADLSIVAIWSRDGNAVKIFALHWAAKQPPVEGRDRNRLGPADKLRESPLER
jgi:hypothetical protein